MASWPASKGSVIEFVLVTQVVVDSVRLALRIQHLNSHDVTQRVAVDPEPGVSSLVFD
jgi:hypothetical protein